MSRAIAVAVNGILLVVLVIAVGGCAGNKLKKENEAYKQQILQLQGDLDNSNAESKRLADQNAQLEAQTAARTAPAPAPGAGASSDLEARAAGLRSQGFVTEVRNGMVIITLPQTVLYNSGNATISKGGRSKLTQVAHALNSEFAGYPLEVQGHTDSDPIRKTKDKYKSNWELSYTRAQNVADYLIKSCKVSAKRVHVSAYGQYDSVAPNSSASNKAKNRRVEIIVMEPGSEAAKAAMESAPVSDEPAAKPAARRTTRRKSAK